MLRVVVVVGGGGEFEVCYAEPRATKLARRKFGLGGRIVLVDRRERHGQAPRELTILATVGDVASRLVHLNLDPLVANVDVMEAEQRVKPSRVSVASLGVCVRPAVGRITRLSRETRAHDRLCEHLARVTRRKWPPLGCLPLVIEPKVELDLGIINVLAPERIKQRTTPLRGRSNSATATSTSR